MKLYPLFAALFIASITISAAYADQNDVYSAASPGDTGRTSGPTNNYANSDAQPTGTQRLGLPKAGFGVLSPAIPGVSGRNNLPNTTLDSFVNSSGASANQIFGAEGETGPPPIFSYEMQNRIGPTLNPGLSTGHGSLLPSAQGAEGEFSHSGGFTPAAPVDTGPIQYMEESQDNENPE